LIDNYNHHEFPLRVMRQHRTGTCSSNNVHFSAETQFTK